ncbi:MAG: FHA domain-containing protein [Hyphomicrobiaceae bacterium]
MSALLVAAGAPVSAQSDNKTDEKGKSSNASINDSVYRVTILHNFYTSLPTEIFVSTAVLVKSPNLLLTTYDGSDVYEQYDYLTKNDEYRTASVCASEPDSVKLEKELKDLEQLLKEKNPQDKKPTEVGRFEDIREKLKAFSGTSQKNETSPKELSAEKIRKETEEIQQRYDQALTGRTRAKDFLAAGKDCRRFTVKKIDKVRRLVLLEAVDRLPGKIPEFNTFNPDVGSSVSAYGFPLSTFEMQTRSASASDAERSRLIPAVIANTVVKVIADEKRSQDRVQADGQRILHQIPISNGLYGGPLVNPCFQIIGLNLKPDEIRVVTQDGTSTLKGKNRGEVGIGAKSIPVGDIFQAIGALEIKTFAELNNFPLRVADKACVITPLTVTNSNPFPAITQNPLIFALGGLALLLAATALVFALRRPQAGVVDTGLTLNGPREDGLFEAGYRTALPPANTTEYSHYTGPAGQIENLPSVAPSGPQAVTAARVRLMPLSGEPAIELDGRKVSSGGVIVGRDNQCDVVTDNSTVSKQHARLSLTPNGKLQVDDLGSANGTWRGRTRIQHEAFANGETVRFGAVEYRIEIIGAGANAVGETVFMTPNRSWLLSGFDEDGSTIHFKLQPEADQSGRQRDTSWIVGRSSDRVHLVLHDKSVSGEQAKIRFTPQRGLEICDLSSSNGTKVDGREVKDSFVVIDDANVIEFGSRKLTLTKGYS